ncbi:hypothetical protein VTJ04DRAFT_9911 [Mycothermus thermophilus]|uniref:uncharacterized protein n=1 Tax=Humicola insolens TaxID=85995 RepID=UPI0037425CC6
MLSGFHRTYRIRPLGIANLQKSPTKPPHLTDDHQLHNIPPITCSMLPVVDLYTVIRSLVRSCRVHRNRYPIHVHTNRKLFMINIQKASKP